MDIFITLVNNMILTFLLSVIALFIISFIIYINVRHLFDKSTTKNIYFRVTVITFFALFFIYLFGLINVPSWVGITAVYSFIFYVVSDDFVVNLFGIKNKNNNTRFMIIKALLFLSVPLLYSSLAFINEDQIKDFIGVNDSYMETRLKNVDTKVEKKSDRLEELIYTKSGFVKKDQRDQETKDVFPLKNIYVKYNNEDWVIEKVVDASEVENPVLLLSRIDRSGFQKKFMIGLSRIFFLECIIILIGLFYIVIYYAIGKTQRNRIKKKIYEFLGGDPDLWKFQGYWYRIQEYPIQNSEYIGLSATFRISGNELRLLGQRFEIIKSEGNLKLENNNEEIKYNPDGMLEIGSYTFVHEESEKWNELNKPKIKIMKNKKYFIVENYNFLGIDIDNSKDPIYYLDDQNLVENKSIIPNRYKIIEGLPITDNTQILKVEKLDNSNSPTNIRKKIEISKIDSNEENKFIIKKVTTLG